MIFSERLRELRLEKGLSQDQLAEKTGLSHGCIAMLEVKKRTPTGITLSTLADFFEVSTDYLLGREDDFGIIQTKTPGESYTREERQLVEDYRALAPDLQEMILATIRTWKSTEANEERKRRTS